MSTDDRRVGRLPNFVKWADLHFTAMQLPERASPEEREDFVHYVRAMKTLLGCATCREEIRTQLLDPATALASALARVDGRQSAVEFVRQLHNHVNRRLGRRQYDRAESQRHWEWYKHHALPPTTPPAATASSRGSRAEGGPSRFLCVAAALVFVVAVLALVLSGNNGRRRPPTNNTSA